MPVLQTLKQSLSGDPLMRIIWPFTTVFLMLLLIGGLLTRTSTSAAESATALPPPAADVPAGDGLQTAIVAGGCFWGVQAVFQHTKGVKQALSGYAGGTKEQASYETVSSGRTGHAESVEIRFDPKQISYGKILQIFFSVAHDPTQLNRQGPDTGPQYRSAIFYRDDAQKKVAEDYIAQLGKAGLFSQKIVTKLDPLAAFYRAEGYHQDYYINHPHQPYIYVNDRPKVENLQKLFPELYTDKPATVAQSGI